MLAVSWILLDDMLLLHGLSKCNGLLGTNSNQLNMCTRSTPAIMRSIIHACGCVSIFEFVHPIGSPSANSAVLNFGVLGALSSER
jgi:hypothetical protein